MLKPPSNPFAAAGDRSVSERFASLKLRTALICAAMLVCAAAGWQLLDQPLQLLIAQAWQLLQGQGSLPPPHVPEADGPGLRSLLQQGALVGVTGLALIGHSFGAFGKLKMGWALLPTLMIALVFAWVAPASRGWLPLVPGPLERDILRGQAAAATSRMQRGDYPSPLLRQYVQAQIALRTSDAAALRREGEPLLLQADRAAYGLDMREGLQLDPDIVLVIDTALNGQPETEVGLRRQREAEGRGSLRDGAAFTGRVLLGAAMLAAAWALLRVWNLMRRRVGTIGQQMQDDAAEAQAQIERASALLARPPRPKSPPPPPVSWRIILRVVVLVSAPVLLVKGMAAFLGSDSPGGVTVTRKAAALQPGEHPCNLVGAWTSSRGNSVFKVTMFEDGRYIAEPIAAGPYGKEHHRGKWDLLDGKRIRWLDDYRPEITNDVNDILDREASSFTLREVNGSKSRFNRIGPAPGQKRCPS